MTPDQLDAAYGLRPGTVRGWVRGGVVPAGLAGRALEHAAVAAYTLRPALSADRLTVRGYAEQRAAINAAHAAAVRQSLARAAAASEDDECPTPTTGPAARSAA